MVSKEQIIKEVDEINAILSKCKTIDDLKSLTKYGFLEGDIKTPILKIKASSGKPIYANEYLNRVKHKNIHNSFSINAIWPGKHISVYSYNIHSKKMQFEVWDKSVDRSLPITVPTTIDKLEKDFDDGCYNASLRNEDGGYWVQTNIGRVPYWDYCEIVAMQHGFDSYSDLRRHGLDIKMKKEDLISPEENLKRDKLDFEKANNLVHEIAEKIQEKYDEVIMER